MMTQQLESRWELRTVRWKAAWVVYMLSCSAEVMKLCPSRFTSGILNEDGQHRSLTANSSVMRIS